MVCFIVSSLCQLLRTINPGWKAWTCFPGCPHPIPTLTSHKRPQNQKECCPPTFTRTPDERLCRPGLPSAPKRHHKHRPGKVAAASPRLRCCSDPNNRFPPHNRRTSPPVVHLVGLTVRHEHKPTEKGNVSINLSTMTVGPPFTNCTTLKGVWMRGEDCSHWRIQGGKFPEVWQS